MQQNQNTGVDGAQQQMQMMYQGNLWQQAQHLAQQQAQEIIANGGAVTEIQLHNMAQGWMQASMQVSAQEQQQYQPQQHQQHYSQQALPPHVPYTPPTTTSAPPPGFN